MSGAAFDTVRQSLRERGLLGSDNRLTAAGNAHAAQLIAQLRRTEAPSDPEARRVRWNNTMAKRGRSDA